MASPCDSKSVSSNDMWFQAKDFIDRLRAAGTIPESNSAAEIFEAYAKVIRDYELIEASLQIAQSCGMKQEFDDLLHRCQGVRRALHAYSVDTHTEMIQYLAGKINRARQAFMQPAGGLSIVHDQAVAVEN